jgi:hypothetical protein
VEDAVELVADRVTWVGGVAEAEGNVLLVSGDQRLAGERATLDGDRVTLEKGRYTRPDGEITFDVAEVSLRTREGRLQHVEAHVRGATITAEELRPSSSAWQAEGATLAACECPDGRPPALTFSAKHLEVQPGEVAILHGGMVRVYRVPLLPVPYWREPLDPRRFRLLFPEVGHGEPGWTANLYGQVGAGDWTFVGGPLWRQDRGIRGSLSAVGPGKLMLEGGWDAETEAGRGAAAAQLATDDGRRRFALDATVQSDPAYAEDYGVTWVARGVGWRESRALLAASGVRARLANPDDGSAGIRAAVQVRPALSDLMSPWAEIGAVEAGNAHARGAAGMDARWSGTRGWLHGEADVSGQGWGYEGGQAGAGALGVARGEVPVWADGLGGRWSWWPGLRTRAGAVAGTGLLPGEEQELAGDVGPAVRGEAVAGKLLAAGEAALAFDGATWAPDATVELHGEHAQVRGEWGDGVRLVEARWAAPLGGSVGLAKAPELWLAWAGANATLGRAVAGVESGYDLDARALSGVALRLGYDDGCSSLTGTASLSPDRELPDFGVAVVLRK